MPQLQTAAGSGAPVKSRYEAYDRGEFLAASV